MWVPINKLCGTSSFTSLGVILKTCGFPILGYFFFQLYTAANQSKGRGRCLCRKNFQEFETLCDVVNHRKGEIVQKNTSAMDLYFVALSLYYIIHILRAWVFSFFYFCQVSRFWCWIAYSVGRYYVGHICL